MSESIAKEAVGGAGVGGGAAAEALSSLEAARLGEFLKQQSDTSKFLLEHKVCPRCCLRFAGCREAELYRIPPPTIDALLICLGGSATSATGTGEDGSCCGLCLGALQHNGQEEEHQRGGGRGEDPGSAPRKREWDGVAHPEGGTWHELAWLRGGGRTLLDCVVACIKEEGHEFKEFELEVLVPAASVLRDRAMSAALEAQGLPPCTIVSLKEAAHMHLLHDLKAATGASHSAGAGMQVTLALHHAATAAEAAPLLPEAAPPRVGRGTKRRLGAAESAVEAAARAGHHFIMAACSRRALEDAANDLESPRLEELCGVPPRAPPPCSAAGGPGAALRCARKARGGGGGGALLLAGCYRKLRRNISQSPWLIDGKQKGSGSVQEVIEAFAMPRLRADSCKLVTAGREDIDVRMLGRGRPFILEVFNPRAEAPAPGEWGDMARRLKEKDLGVEIMSPQCVGRDIYSHMKEGESEKEKTYSALIWIGRPFTDEDVAKINSIKDLSIHQGTPVRVLHRRAALTRERKILYMELRPVPSAPNYAVLELKASAGTYIKEFVHGDFGRTQPNVGSLLGCSATITQLDVLDVHLDFL